MATISKFKMAVVAHEIKKEKHKVRDLDRRFWYKMFQIFFFFFNFLFL